MATGPFRASVTLALALVVAATALTAQAADVGPPPVLVKSYGPGFELPDRPSRLGDMASGDEITEYDLSYGCIVGGVAGTGLSVGAGGLNVINLIAGGIVPAATPVAATTSASASVTDARKGPVAIHPSSDTIGRDSIRGNVIRRRRQYLKMIARAEDRRTQRPISARRGHGARATGRTP